jgi:hypothetical protein
MSRLLLFISWACCLLVSPAEIRAQNPVAGTVSSDQLLTGTVRDARTREPLAFVSIQINNGPGGTTTDIDGRFTVRSSVPVERLKFTYLGYEPHTAQGPFSPSEPLAISLKEAVTTLTEVEIRKGQNPAHRIIKAVVANRDRNNPEKIRSFRYRSYNKLVLTGTPDKVNMSDTLRTGPMSSADSAREESRRLLAKQHLFLVETVTERIFRQPDQSQETVLASRASGFKNPKFTLLATDFQPFSFYEDYVTLLSVTYLNPISPGSTRKYDFTLESTNASDPQDTVFIVSYRPFPGKNFEGLQGQLHIHSQGWAIENVIAGPVEETRKGTRVQQQYQRIGRQWFPAQLNTDISFPGVQMPGASLVGMSRSYITAVELEPPLRGRDFGALTVQISPDANGQTESFLKEYRTDTLNARDRETYRVVDSLGNALKFDKWLGAMEAILSGRVPLGLIDVDLNRLLRVNRYEALRLGFGAHTSERVSRFVSLGAYAGYGFKDKGWKYGSDLSFLFHRSSGLKLTFSYFEDVLESGGRQLPFQNRPLLTGNLRPLLIRNMDKVTHQGANLTFRTLRYLSVDLGMRTQLKRSTNGYKFQPGIDATATSRYRFTESVIGLRYAYREKLAQAGSGTMSLGTDYPVFWLQFTQGFQGLLEGEFDYRKWEAKAEQDFRLRGLGRTKLSLLGGLVEGSVPYANLFNGHGSFDRKYRVYAAEGFETMGLTEFLTDRYGAVFLSHDFERLLYQHEHFKPRLVLLTNIAWGDLRHPGQHRNISFRTLEKGYYESGLLVNDIITQQFSTMGIGVFYRYGPYRNPEPIDNVMLKLSTGFVF